MQRNIFILIILFIFSSCNYNSSNNGQDNILHLINENYISIDTIYYDNGNINNLVYTKSETEYVTIYFYKNGRKRNISGIKSRQCDGEYIDWFENGNIKWIRYYNNGVQIGESKSYYENGSIKEIWDNATFTHKIYYKNGKLQSYFDKDSLIKNYIGGNHLLKKTFTDKDGSSIEFFDEDSSISFAGKYFDSKLHKEGYPFSGNIVSYFKNGDTALFSVYLDGLLDGKFFCKYGTGQLEFESTLEMGKPVGLRTDYYLNGQKSSIENFQTGETIHWDENGNKK